MTSLAFAHPARRTSGDHGSRIVVLGLTVAVVAVVVLIGWALDIGPLKTIVPGVVSMKVNTALALLGIGLSVATSGRGTPTGLSRALWIGGAALGITLGVASLLEYLAGVDLHIDQVLFRDLDAGLNPAGRPAPATAMSMALLGLAAVAIPIVDRRVSMFALVAAAVAMLIAFMGMLGQLYGAAELVGAGGFFRLALHTSVAVLVLGFAIIGATLSRGPLAYLAGSTLGGRLSRGLIVTILIGLPLLGLLRLTGERMGMFSQSFGLFVMVVGSGAALAALGVWAGRWLDRTEHALRASETRYRAAKDGALDAFLVYQAVRDPAGRIIDFTVLDTNAVAGTYLRRSRDELIGGRLTALEPEVVGSSIFQTYIRCVEERATVDEAISLPGPERLEWYHHQLVPVGDGLAVTSRRITERVAADDRLRQLNDDLGQSNAELRQFASIVSHDLRAPLRRIQTFTESIGDVVAASDDETAKDHFARIQRSAAAMQDLIGDLLEYARVGTAALELQPIDLEALVRSVATELRGDQAAAPEVVVESSKLPMVVGDVTHLGQLIANLIDNAIKFARPGTIPRIWLTGRPLADKPGRTRIDLRDDGVGFEAAYAERIFDIFERVHPPGIAPGTGVGLAICRRVVERHDGTIAATSAPGQGAIFSFDLALAPAAAA